MFDIGDIVALNSGGDFFTVVGSLVVDDEQVAVTIAYSDDVSALNFETLPVEALQLVEAFQLDEADNLIED
jgi:hypothetical protein